MCENVLIIKKPLTQRYHKLMLDVPSPFHAWFSAIYVCCMHVYMSFPSNICQLVLCQPWSLKPMDSNHRLTHLCYHHCCAPLRLSAT